MIRIFFGNIGCGKTTLAARMFYKHIRRDQRQLMRDEDPSYDGYFCNFPCTLADEVSLEGLGSWTFPERSYVVVDESGIEYNSRKFKSLPQETISWLKLSRHFRCDVDFISQSFDDMDLTIRRLASELWYVKKLGPFTMIRRIYKRVGIDQDTHQIVDFYEFGKLLPCLLPFPFHQHNIEIFLRAPYYKFFDSFANPGLSVSDDCSKYSKPYAPTFFEQLLYKLLRHSPTRLERVLHFIRSLKVRSYRFFLRCRNPLSFLPFNTKTKK